MNTDEELILDFQQGSSDAFEELFHRYREAVYGFFRRRVNDAGRAEELAQEVFLAILRNVARYEPRALFRSYLFGIAFKLLVADRRKQHRETSPPAVLAESSHQGDPEASFWVRAAVEQLDPEAREILMLREFEHLSYSEIASLLRLPVNTVRSRLFRARRSLKEMLVPEPGTS